MGPGCVKTPQTKKRLEWFFSDRAKSNTVKISHAPKCGSEEDLFCRLRASLRFYTAKARRRHPPVRFSLTTPLIHNHPRAIRTVQQPLEMKAGQLIISMFSNMGCKTRHRTRIAGFQFGKRLKITLCRGIFVLLASE